MIKINTFSSFYDVSSCILVFTVACSYSVWKVSEVCSWLWSYIAIGILAVVWVRAYSITILLWYSWITTVEACPVSYTTFTVGVWPGADIIFTADAWPGAYTTFTVGAWPGAYIIFTVDAWPGAYTIFTILLAYFWITTGNIVWNWTYTIFTILLFTTLITTTRAWPCPFLYF